MEDKDINKLIGNRIKLVRKLNHLSQIDFAKILGCAQATIVTIEVGKVSLSSIYLIILMKKLNVNPMFILGYSKTIYLTKYEEVNIEEISNLSPYLTKAMKISKVDKP